MGLPDISYINGQVPISEVARELGLRIGSNGNLHCWRPAQHQHADRTASVGVHKSRNTVKCFGCGVGPLTCLDLVMSVLEIKNPGKAARWIGQRFDVPDLPPRKHLVQPQRRTFEYGSESDIGLLVYSGLWAGLSPPARAIAPVLLEFADRDSTTGILVVRISYRAISRYSGVRSPNAIATVIRELQEIHWLKLVVETRVTGSGPVRAAPQPTNDRRLRDLDQIELHTLTYFVAGSTTNCKQ